MNFNILNNVITTEPVVDLKKVASLETGDVVQTLAGPTFRVIAKSVGNGKTVLRFANLAGHPVDLTAEKLAALVPLSPLFARIAARFRLWSIQYGGTIGSGAKQGTLPHMAALKFSQVINEALQQAGLPVDPKMNWDAWFNRVYLDRLYNNSDVTDKDLIREVTQDVVITELWDRGALAKFQASIASWKPLQQYKDAPPEKQVSEYLKLLFGYRYSDAVDRLRKMSNPVDTPSGRRYRCESCGKEFFSGAAKNELACPDCQSKEVTPYGGTTPMFVESPDEEAPVENVLDTQGINTQPEAEEKMQWEDIGRFSKLFGSYLDKVEKPKKAKALKLLYKLMLQSAMQDTATSHSTRRLYADEWMEKTGLSHDAFKLYIRDILRYLEQFVDENPEYEHNFAFVQLLKNVLNKKRKEEEPTAEVPVAEPKASSLKLAETDPYENMGRNDPSGKGGGGGPIPATNNPQLEDLKDKSKMPSTRTSQPGPPARTIPPEIPGEGGVGMLVHAADEKCHICGRPMVNGGCSDPECASYKTGGDMQAAELGKHCTNCGSKDIQTVPQAGTYVDVCKGCGNVGEFSNFFAKSGTSFQVGDEVRGRMESGAYFNGEVSSIKEDGSVNISRGKVVKTFPVHAVELRADVEQEAQRNQTDYKRQQQEEAEARERERAEGKSDYARGRRERLKEEAITVTDYHGNPEMMANALRNEGYKLYLTYREFDQLETAVEKYEEWSQGAPFDEQCAKQYETAYTAEWHLVYDDPGGELSRQYGFFNIVPSGVTGHDWRKGEAQGYSLGDRVSVQRSELIEPLVRAGLRMQCSGSVQELRASVEKMACSIGDIVKMDGKVYEVGFVRGDNVKLQDPQTHQRYTQGYEANWIPIANLDQPAEESKMSALLKTGRDISEKMSLGGHEYSLNTWQERDRFNICLRDETTGKDIIDLWDEDATQFVEDGFFDFRRPIQSALEYAQDMGMIKQATSKKAMVEVIQIKDLGTNHRELLGEFEGDIREVEEEGTDYGPFDAVQYEGKVYQVHGGIRNPLFINIDHPLPIKMASSKTARTEYQEELLEKKYAEECPACGAISAYDWNDCNFCENCTEPMGEDIPEDDRVYHIGASSGFEWECGKCRRSWTPEDSPLNADVYTHGDSSNDEIEVESSVRYETKDAPGNPQAVDGMVDVMKDDESYCEACQQHKPCSCDDMAADRKTGEVAVEEPLYKELDDWWQSLDQGIEKPVGYGPAPDEIVLEDMGEMLAQERKVRNMREGIRVAQAWREARWTGVDFQSDEPEPTEDDIDYAYRRHSGAAPSEKTLLDAAKGTAPHKYQGLGNTICDSCGNTMNHPIHRVKTSVDNTQLLVILHDRKVRFTKEELEEMLADPKMYEQADNLPVWIQHALMETEQVKGTSNKAFKEAFALAMQKIKGWAEGTPKKIVISERFKDVYPGQKNTWLRTLKEGGEGGWTKGFHEFVPQRDSSRDPRCQECGAPPSANQHRGSKQAMPKPPSLVKRKPIDESEAEHPGAVCSLCGRTVTNAEYSYGGSKCCDADVVGEEAY